MENSYILPKLDYSFDALEPSIDAQTMEIHYSKHHQTYLDKFVAAISTKPELNGKPIEGLIKNLYQLPEDVQMSIRNMGGGYYNHNLFWNSISPKKVIPEALKSKIVEDFGTFEKFQELFTNAALGLFGSGWAWLVKDNSTQKLKILTTQNQDNPISSSDVTILLALDVWEHAYYLKYQNKRADYVTAFWNIINWDYAFENFKK